MCLLITLTCSPKAELRRAQRDLSLALTCRFCPYMPFIQSSNKDVTNSEIKHPARWLTFPAHLLFGANWIDKIQCSKIWWWLNLPAAICNKRHKAPIKEGQRLNPRCRWITCENTCPKGACSQRQLSIITRGDPCTNIINVDALKMLWWGCKCSQSQPQLQQRHELWLEHNQQHQGHTFSMSCRCGFCLACVQARFWHDVYIFLPWFCMFVPNIAVFGSKIL